MTAERGWLCRWTVKIEAADKDMTGKFSVYVVEVWGESKRLAVTHRRCGRQPQHPPPPPLLGALRALFLPLLLALLLVLVRGVVRLALCVVLLPSSAHCRRLRRYREFDALRKELLESLGDASEDHDSVAALPFAKKTLLPSQKNSKKVREHSQHRSRFLPADLAAEIQSPKPEHEKANAHPL